MSVLSRTSWIRLVLGMIVAAGLFAAVLLWPAGRLDWTAGWSYLLLFLATMLVSLVYLLRVNPEVVEHRMQIKKGTKRWDIVWSVLFAPLFLAMYVVAGFDAVRFGWSNMPLQLWPMGAVLWLLGNALFTWSMGVNPYFEKTVRIQTERGHHVIDTGPYALIRHPGYLGFFGWALSTPLLLGSWWALVPALLSIASLVVRTGLEDRTLREELGGYQEYAGRVRYRLVPGIW